MDLAAHRSARCTSEFGYASPAAGDDPLTALGEHFFPSVLEARGHASAGAPAAVPRLIFAAAVTDPPMWNTPPGGPFRYDQSAEQLWTRLPLLRRPRCSASSARSASCRRPSRRRCATSSTGPRALLAPFALIFGNFERSAHRLQAARDDHARWRILRHEFDRFYRRCRVIVGHLAGHVAAIGR